MTVDVAFVSQSFAVYAPVPLLTVAAAVPAVTFVLRYLSGSPATTALFRNATRIAVTVVPLRSLLSPTVIEAEMPVTAALLQALLQPMVIESWILESIALSHTLLSAGMLGSVAAASFRAESLIAVPVVLLRFPLTLMMIETEIPVTVALLRTGMPDSVAVALFVATIVAVALSHTALPIVAAMTVPRCSAMVALFHTELSVVTAVLLQPVYP